MAASPLGARAHCRQNISAKLWPPCFGRLSGSPARAAGSAQRSLIATRRQTPDASLLADSIRRPLRLSRLSHCFRCRVAAPPVWPARADQCQDSRSAPFRRAEQPVGAARWLKKSRAPFVGRSLGRVQTDSRDAQLAATGRWPDPYRRQLTWPCSAAPAQCRRRALSLLAARLAPSRLANVHKR